MIEILAIIGAAVLFLFGGTLYEIIFGDKEEVNDV